jgi:phosphoribosylaminoimidazole-succinocarboxamide synthase
VVMPNGIPFKGKVLTSISCFWFELLQDTVAHHLITADVKEYPSSLHKHREVLRGRSMLVKKTKPFPVECIVRGYLSGSGWKEYGKTGAVCGIPLPPGLRESEKLAQPIFTPSTKAEQGHDENVSTSYVEGLIGKDASRTLQEMSLAVYTRARDYAADKGIIIADTKFEFGSYHGKCILIDEVLTPDSSRFWPADSYAPGRGQPSFDKQFVRDYLESLTWDKTPPAPELPEDIVDKTSRKYLEAYARLTGRELEV